MNTATLEAVKHLTDRLVPQEKLVEELRKLSVISQTTDQVVTKNDWRDSDFDFVHERNNLFVYLLDEDGTLVAAVFDYDTMDFSYNYL